MTDKPLSSRVALVAGATRGAGRGIARELAHAGAKVYCTGRSTRLGGATPGRPETIDETVDMIVAEGGKAVSVRVDHSKESEVEALAARLRREEGRLDILVNDIWGGDELIDFQAKFWMLDIAKVRQLIEQGILTHLITSRHMTPLMLEAGRGLIVEITDGELPGYRGQLLYDFVKASVNRLAYAMAFDLIGTGVTALAVSPGFLRSEAMLDLFKTDEANWRDGAKLNPSFVWSESPRYIGRAIAALAADPNVASKAGQALWGAALAREYGFTDSDGSRPDFWLSVEHWLEQEMAKPDELFPGARQMALARYGHIHKSPERARQAAVYAKKLGFEGLSPALGPAREG
jgi:NAD(P)-dependent dehydrogenase (short-subunit alcohol dehydrogenase family)